jgi:hypothetical protein
MFVVRTLSMTSAFWLVLRSPRRLVTVRRHAAILKAVEPLFNLSDPHRIIAERLLNFEDCFR